MQHTPFLTCTSPSKVPEWQPQSTPLHQAFLGAFLMWASLGNSALRASQEHHLDFHFNFYCMSWWHRRDYPIGPATYEQPHRTNCSRSPVDGETINSPPYIIAHWERKWWCRTVENIALPLGNTSKSLSRWYTGSSWFFFHIDFWLPPESPHTQKRILLQLSVCLTNELLPAGSKSALNMLLNNKRLQG